jgi:dienelactone hydrolase
MAMMSERRAALVFEVMSSRVLSQPMLRRQKAFAIIGIPIVLAIAGATLGYDHARGAAFLVRAAGIDGAVRTVADWATDPVTTSETSIPWRGGLLRARMYQAADPDDTPVLLVPGVHAGGIDEPRLVQFARDVAAMGRNVVTAELPDLKAYAITTRTTDMIEDAGVWLAKRSPDGRIGMMGISFAGGLSLVAAARPSLRDHVAFVLSFGGHGDLPRTLRYLCTGEIPGGGSRPPHDYGIAIILLGVAARMVPAEQVQPLRTAILAFLNASHVDMWDKAQAQVEFARATQMAEALSEPSRTLMTYVNTRDVARLGPLLLPHAAEMGGSAALSPSNAPTPTFPVYLLHGTDDNVIPAAESALLADTLRRRGANVWQLATPLITHAEVDRSADAGSAWQLVRFWTSLLDAE